MGLCAIFSDIVSIFQHLAVGTPICALGCDFYLSKVGKNFYLLKSKLFTETNPYTKSMIRIRIHSNHAFIILSQFYKMKLTAP